MSKRKPQNFLEVITRGLCQYINGDPKKAPVYCNKKPKSGSAYCEEHHEKCHIKEEKKNEV